MRYIHVYYLLNYSVNLKTALKIFFIKNIMSIYNASTFLFMGIQTIETHTHVCVSEWVIIALLCLTLCNFMDYIYIYISQFSSVSQSCLTLCNPMDCTTPGFLVHHQLLQLVQTHVHWVGDAIQPSHPLSFPSPPTLSFPASGSFPMSQFFASGGQSIGVSASTSVLSMNIQDWFPLGWTVWISLQSKGLSRGFSNIAVQKHEFFSTQLSLQSNSHIHTWLLEKP